MQVDPAGGSIPVFRAGISLDHASRIRRFTIDELTPDRVNYHGVICVKAAISTRSKDGYIRRLHGQGFPDTLSSIKIVSPGRDRFRAGSILRREANGVPTLQSPTVLTVNTSPTVAMSFT